MAFGWRVPFYVRDRGSRGIIQSDIISLEDIVHLPPYGKSDLMASLEAHPPIGDFHGLDSYADDQRPPLIFHTTAGTTGRPPPLLLGPRSREVQSLMLARLYALMGTHRRDVVHSVYGHGMINGGHYVREGMTHWTGAQFLSAGTGVETRSAHQVGLMRDFGATVIVGFGDYIKRLAEVAREEGLEPARDIPVRMIAGHIGGGKPCRHVRPLGRALAYDWYGVGDTGAIAAEGPDKAGMHVQEDAQYHKILDSDSCLQVADVQTGDMVVTCM